MMEIERAARGQATLGGEIERRLGSVLRPTQPHPAATAPGNQVREVKAPLAEAIESIALRLSACNQTLREILQRAEV